MSTLVPCDRWGLCVQAIKISEKGQKSPIDLKYVVYKHTFLSLKPGRDPVGEGVRDAEHSERGFQQKNLRAQMLTRQENFEPLLLDLDKPENKVSF